MKTPEQWQDEICVVSNPGSFRVTLEHIEAIQSDARAGMVPAAELRPIKEAVEYLGCHEHNDHQSTCSFCCTVDEALARLETLLGEKGGQ